MFKRFSKASEFIYLNRKYRNTKIFHYNFTKMLLNPYYVKWYSIQRRVYLNPWTSFLHKGGKTLDIFSLIIRRRQWHPTPILLFGKSHGRRSLVGCSPWGCYELDTTERLHFYFSLSWIGEGNGNPLQCSCLENPRNGGAWWAAVYGVTQSRTRLKQLSSSKLS